MKGNAKVTPKMRSDETILIPELEEAMERYQPHKTTWSDKDNAILKRYYCRVPITSLESTFHRGSKMIHNQAVRLGGTRGEPFEAEP
jgi:hypothetical protein